MKSSSTGDCKKRNVRLACDLVSRVGMFKRTVADYDNADRVSHGWYTKQLLGVVAFAS